ncbi:Major facilitator superfamily domain, general substrate transporter [Pseudocohnilembus persalinus]|uniref:Major facilitator superfamily domain, general substrate transporter n=1 Tax=Pseudocohnilembus persalinus TaxID=266149 RepID=A0A0V0QHI3_PSEPJ|nr:Major facilitator superfamily domain, general substrate transporter [Pseudocohnilembus persalinus]|eukprot:KRX01731.1 Major facilitator superfamily domain, general substrate transporter [Pseudocohnilembus persalinus]
MALFLMTGTLGLVYNSIPFIFYRPKISCLSHGSENYTDIQEKLDALDFTQYKINSCSELQVCKILESNQNQYQVLQQQEQQTVYSVISEKFIENQNQQQQKYYQSSIYIFYYEQPLESISKEFQLTCENKIKETQIQSLSFGSQVLGAIFGIFLRFSHTQIKYIYTGMSLVMSLCFFSFQLVNSLVQVGFLLCLWNVLYTFYVTSVHYFCQLNFPVEFGKYSSALLNLCWGSILILQADMFFYQNLCTYIGCTLFLPNFRDNLSFQGFILLICFIIFVFCLDYKENVCQENIERVSQRNSCVDVRLEENIKISNLSLQLSETNQVIYIQNSEEDEQQNNTPNQKQQKDDKQSLLQNQIQLNQNLSNKSQAQDIILNTQQDSKQKYDDNNNKNKNKNKTQVGQNNQEQMSFKKICFDFYDNFIEMRLNPQLFNNMNIWILCYITGIFSFTTVTLILDQLDGNLYLNTIGFSLIEVSGGVLSGWIVYKGWDLKQTLKFDYYFMGFIYLISIVLSMIYSNNQGWLSVFISMTPIIIAKLSFELLWTLLITYLRDVMPLKYQLLVFSLGQLLSKFLNAIIPFYMYLSQAIGFNYIILTMVLCFYSGYLIKDFVQHKYIILVTKQDIAKDQNMTELCNL